MPPRAFQAVMRVNHLWYSEANRVLCNKIKNLLNGKGLCTWFSVYEEVHQLYCFLDQYILPPTFEAKKNVAFFAKGEWHTAELSVISILEKEGLDDLPEGEWRDSPDFVHAYLSRPYWG
jgi:hypothetical protein